MKRFHSYWFPLLALIILAAACQSEHEHKSDALRYIPDDITSLTIIDVPDLMEKANYDALIQLPAYQKFLMKAAKEHATIAAVWQDPSSSGLDTDQHFYLAAHFKSFDDSPAYAAFIAPVKDKDLLEQNLAALEVQFVPTAQHFGHSKLDDMHMVWNDEVLVMGIGSAAYDFRAKIESFLNTTPKGSIYSNRNLQKSLDQDFDVANWTRIDPFLEKANDDLMASLLGISRKDLSDNYINSYLHFREGEMEGESYFDLKRGLTNDLQLLFKDEVKTKFIQYMPGDELVAMMAAAIDLKGINQLLIEKHVKGSGIQKLEELGLSFDDFIRAFTGEVAVGLYSGDRGEAIPLGIFPIEKEKRFEKLLNFALDKDILSDLGQGRYGIESAKYDDGLLQRVGDILYISNDEALLDKVAKGDFRRGGNTIENMAHLMPDNIFSAYANIKQMQQMESDLSTFPFGELKTFANRNKAAFILKMKDPNSNALWQLFKEMNDKAL